MTKLHTLPLVKEPRGSITDWRGSSQGVAALRDFNPIPGGLGVVVGRAEGVGPGFDRPTDTHTRPADHDAAYKKHDAVHNWPPRAIRWLDRPTLLRCPRSNGRKAARIILA